jgi:hypothetical protein
MRRAQGPIFKRDSRRRIHILIIPNSINKKHPNTSVVASASSDRMNQ